MMADYKLSMVAARVNAGLTQKEVATALGVSPSTIVAWERGHSIPFADKFKKYCMICNVPMDNVLLPNEQS